MSSSDVLKELLQTLDTGGYDKARTLLDKDFKFSGPMPGAVGRDEFIAFEKSIRTAMPDLKHNGVISWEGRTGEVRGEVRIAGTQTGSLDMPYIPNVNPSNKAVKLPTERWTANVKDGKVISFAAEVGPDGGLLGILKQIGRDDLADCLRTHGLDCRLYEENAGMGPTNI